MIKKLMKRKKKVTQPVHNSIQIWYQGKNNNQAELELDINIWRLKENRGKQLMDFGLKISKASDVEKVYIYFPFEFDKKEIFDLGETFKNGKMIKGIFNENYIVSSNTNNPKNILVKDDVTNNVLFSIYTFDINGDFTVQNLYSGTVISFKVKTTNQSDVRYYRFRIALKQYYPFIEHHRPENSFFESALIETELLDFRINEKRNQDPNLIEKICEETRFNISNINFFVMTSIKDEVVSDGINLIYKRQLEMGDFWKDYLGMQYGKMSVYKCNNIKKNKQGFIEDFSCFAKINYRKSNLITIIKYLIVLFIITVVFSVCANVISNIVWHYIEPLEWRAIIK